jgi:hypothetical protein
MNGSGKHSSLLRYGTITAVKSFIVQAPAIIVKFYTAIKGKAK